MDLLPVQHEPTKLSSRPALGSLLITAGRKERATQFLNDRPNEKLYIVDVIRGSRFSTEIELGDEWRTSFIGRMMPQKALHIVQLALEDARDNETVAGVLVRYLLLHNHRTVTAFYFDRQQSIVYKRYLLDEAVSAQEYNRTASDDEVELTSSDDDESSDELESDSSND